MGKCYGFILLFMLNLGKNSEGKSLGLAIQKQAIKKSSYSVINKATNHTKDAKPGCSISFFVDWLRLSLVKNFEAERKVLASSSDL